MTRLNKYIFIQYAENFALNLLIYDYTNYNEQVAWKTLLMNIFSVNCYACTVHFLPNYIFFKHFGHQVLSYRM